MRAMWPNFRFMSVQCETLGPILRWESMLISMGWCFSGEYAGLIAGVSSEECYDFLLILLLVSVSMCLLDHEPVSDDL